MDNFLNGLKSFVTNYLFITAVVAWFTAQVLKIFTKSLSHKKKSFKTLVFSTGGMPSSHSATMMGLTTAAAIKEGFGSSIFAVCAILSIVVMTDAFGVRYETGKQAKMLNKMLKKENDEKEDDEKENSVKEEVVDEATLTKAEKKQLKKAKMELSFNEFVGHTPFQVVMGALVGICVGIALAFAFVY